MTAEKPSSQGKALPPLKPQHAEAIRLIDEAHSQDPNLNDGPNGPQTLPYELHYAHKMTKWLAEHSPDASPVLQIACRAQHFQRWQLPRNSFPMNRTGYLTWRSKQKSVAASQVSSLLASPSINPPLAQADIDRVAFLIRKEQLSSDEETQTLEDVACLVFLDDQFDGFESKGDIDEDKMVNILRKTWGKMGARGRELALAMDLSPRAKTLIGMALET